MGYWYLIDSNGAISPAFTYDQLQGELHFWALTKHKVYAFWSMFGDLR
jgi:hypothetical protein